MRISLFYPWIVSEGVRVLAFSDWRTQDLDLPLAVAREIGDIDLIIYAGDDVRRFATGSNHARANLLAAISKAGASVGGGGYSENWVHSSGWFRTKKPLIGFGIVFVDSGAELPPAIVGGPVTTADGRVGIVLEAKDIRALSQQRMPPWSTGWLLNTEVELQPIDPHAIAASILAAPRGIVVLSLGRRKKGPQRPADFREAVYAAVGIEPPPPRNRFQRLARLARDGVAAVIGNDCKPNDSRYLDAPGVHDVHATPLVARGWTVLGLQGAPGKLGLTLYSERAASRHLDEQLASALTPEKVIVVTHAPPAGTLDLAVRYGFDHIGSKALAKFIARHHPRLIVCGHVHREGGRSALLGSTLVVNAANHDDRDSPARLALIDLPDVGMPSVEWLEPDLVRIQGIGPSIKEELWRRRIHTTRELMTFVAAQQELESSPAPVPLFGPERTRRAFLHAAAIRSRRFVADPVIPPMPALPESAIYLSIQTTTSPPRQYEVQAEPPLPWCISVRAQDGTVTHFWTEAGKPTVYAHELRRAIDGAIDLVQELQPEFVLTWGGRQKETIPWAGWVLGGAAKRHRFKEEGVAIEHWPWLDLRWRWTKRLLPPARSWKLRELRRSIEAASVGIDGFLAGRVYERFRAGGPEPNWDELLDYATSTIGFTHRVRRLAEAAAGVQDD